MISGSFTRSVRRLAFVAAASIALAACQGSEIPKQLKPVPRALVAKMKQIGSTETGKVFIRIFKESSELEVWKQKRDGTYALLKEYHVCKWSGVLGPKLKEGDRQAPEGFYTVTPAQMNPNSSYYLSFNIGYPNSFDRSLNRTGSHLMVHGACSSAGCYSMTDEDAGEIFAIARDAFKGGQRSFQIQAFPFRMTAENLAKHRDNPNMTFWRQLKEGYDHFELTQRPPKVDVCDRRYVFNADAKGKSFNPTAACPAYEVPAALAKAVAAKQAQDDAAIAAIVAGGQPVAAQAPRPNLMSRIFNRGRNQTPAAATPVAYQQQVPASVLPSRPGTGVVPVPNLRPTTTASVRPTLPTQPVQQPQAPARLAEPVPPPFPDPEPQQDVAAAPDGSSNLGQPIPPSGRFVKRPFNWFGDS